MFNRLQATAARPDGPASFAATLAEKTQAVSNAATGPAGAQQADFSNMTRQEMRDWVNGEIKNGRMTLDESSPFMLMTMKVPVGGGAEIPAAGDSERINFMQRARLGIEGALFRNDAQAAKSLQAALDIMLKTPEQASGIYTRA
ncbi:hypothetical protein [Janthinobacterium sp.]|uniref:hypothetical protein n=1 Tax=Janthinobacterium sp. TaxID=1871054 RepID=UPI00260BA6C5|nr:hypothetical protein [Janthinobacterium sp.]